MSGVKRSVVSVLMVVVLLLMAACSSKTEGTDKASTSPTPSATASPEQTDKPHKDPVTITFSTFNGWGNNESIKLALKKYEEATGNKVEVQLYPDDQFVNLMKAKLATGDVPDILSLFNDQSSIPTDTLEPLEGPWVDTLIDTAKKNATRKSDGAIVNAPWASVPFLGILYNKELFAKAGIEVPFKTYSEFLAACEKLKKAGITPILYNGKEAGAIEIGSGMHYVFEKNPTLGSDLMTNKIKPSDSTDLVEAFTKLTDKINKGYVNPQYKSLTGMDGLEAVATGKAGMFFNGTWCYGIIKQSFPGNEDKVGFLPFTLSDDYIAVTQLFNGQSFQVPKKSKHKEEAKELINFILQPDILKAMYELTPGISPYKGLETKANSWEIEINKYAEQFNWPRKDATDIQYLPGFDTTSALGEQAQSIQYGKDVKKALDDWYQKYADLHKAKRDPGF
ncbi:ABC transporter substrate-binding protein [Cohnella silvisoli]|uniref:Extracellular solute-binding protein n=1 Tax=Cohnella silvisoli TaxID=2873699 RepID=A0ABV1KT29_9BACL|nr:extracellular solute-binding protein [Cohnella silvisoli]MCD9021453.1 extracellular solute-binding protein [Cohnella silvisoli]